MKKQLIALSVFATILNSSSYTNEEGYTGQTVSINKEISKSFNIFSPTDNQGFINVKENSYKKFSLIYKYRNDIIKITQITNNIIKVETIKDEDYLTNATKYETLDKQEELTFKLGVPTDDTIINLTECGGDRFIAVEFNSDNSIIEITKRLDTIILTLKISKKDTFNIVNSNKSIVVNQSDYEWQPPKERI